jgi:DNA helicase II / ATP-dependent DNA helicase PcrA
MTARKATIQKMQKTGAKTTPQFDELYAKLNPKQKEAVDAIEGPVMVVAGPGTGKTQILTLRIANILLKTDTDPDSILALTFTESGAHAMRKRLVEIIGTPAYKVNIHTFHGFCNEVIKKYPEEFPRIISSTNATEIDQIDIIENIIEDNSFEYIKPYGDTYYYVKPLLGSIRELKREGVSPDEFAKILAAQEKEFAALPDLCHEKGAHKGKMKGEYKDIEKKLAKNKELAVVYGKYQETLESSRLYDWEDMILEVVKVFKDNPDFLLMLQEQYQYILADEHQDTNSAQNTILELLANFHESPNLFIVGDEKQAIFRFQGASLGNFLYFQNLYKDVRLIRLEDNYRSTQTILDSAHSVIAHLSEGDPTLRVRLKSNTKSAPQSPTPHINLLAFSKPDFEYLFLVRDIEKRIASGIAPHEIAVLYRDNRDVDEIVRYLEKTTIPFVVESDQDVLRNPIIRKLILLIRTVANVGDDALLAEALHIDFLGFDPLNIYKLIVYAAHGGSKKERLSLYDVLSNDKHLIGAKIGDRERCKDFYRHLMSWVSTSKNSHFLEFLDKVINESGLLASIIQSDGSLDGLHILDSFFNEIRSVSENHKDYSIADFIQYLAVLEKYGLMVRRGGESIVRGVRLMTAHKSKGLEFDHVYITGCFDGHWGNRKSKSMFSLSLGSQAQVKNLGHKGNNDDERRLFYVALTRARTEVTVTYAKENLQGKSQLPSQFLTEIDPQLVKDHDTSGIETELRAHVGAKFSPKLHHGVRLDDKTYLNELFLNQGLSVTALNNYLLCPWRYFYSNLVRIPKPQDKAAMYGTAVHNALSSFFNMYKEEREVSPEMLAALFEGELARLPLGEKDFAESLEKGRESLAGYYTTYAGLWPRNIFNEFDIRGVSVDVDNNLSIVLRGKLDKVELIDASGNVNVVDYKTGKPRSRNDILGTTASSEGNYKRQLVFYKLLLDGGFPDKYKMVSGEIDFVEPGDNGKYRKERFEVDPGEVLELKKEISRVGKEIINLDFWNRRCDDKDCEFCALREVMRD